MEADVREGWTVGAVLPSTPEAEERRQLRNFPKSFLKSVGDGLDTLPLTDKETSSELRRLAPGLGLNQCRGESEHRALRLEAVQTAAWNKITASTRAVMLWTLGTYWKVILDFPVDFFFILRRSYTVNSLWRINHLLSCL